MANIAMPSLPIYSVNINRDKVGGEGASISTYDTFANSTDVCLHCSMYILCMHVYLYLSVPEGGVNAIHTGSDGR